MSNNWAIVIGINHYDHHPERQLKYAVPDAQLIYDFLCNHAGFAPDHILLCLGDQEYRASSTYPTYSTLLRILNRELHPDRIGKVDRLWFFFGGHGVSQNGRDYLLTSDSLIEDIELKIALPIDEVIASLRRHQAADIVLILDNCRQQQGSRKFIADEVGKQTIELAQSRGITTIFSCDYGQYSYELASLKQGAFTYALVEGLKQFTLPDKLEPYLRHRVAELNQRSDQIPRIRVEPAAKALQPLLPGAVTTADVTVLVDRAREAELEENFEAAKQAWWQVIEVSQSGDRLRKGRMAIERIDRKIDRLRSDLPIGANPPQPKLPPPSASSGASPNPIIPPKKEAQQQNFSFSLPILNAGDQTTDKGSTSESSAVINPNVFTREPIQVDPDPEIDYTNLQDLLKAQHWKEADHATYLLMLQVFGREQWEWITARELLNFPCSVLRLLDQLWLAYSDGRFGFSAQQQIWYGIGGQLGRFDEKLFYDFGDRVGWRSKKDWLRYDDFTFSLDAEKGHLPSFGYGVERWDRWADSFPSFFPRVIACLQQEASN